MSEPHISRAIDRTFDLYYGVKRTDDAHPDGVLATLALAVAVDIATSRIVSAIEQLTEATRERGR